MTDLELITKVKKALSYFYKGDPIKDVIDDNEIIEALILLNHIWHDTHD